MRVGMSWDELGWVGMRWDELGRVGTSWDELGWVGTSWDELGQLETTWNNLGQPWMSWKPKKLHNFELKKNVLRKKEERKKKNIGYRVASNKRRLIIIKLNYLDLHHQNERHLRGDTKNHEQINRLYREGMHRTSTGLSFFYLTIFFLCPITPTTCLRSEIVTERILNITRPETCFCKQNGFKASFWHI